MKEQYNFAKHADQDPEKELEYHFDLVEMALFIAATDYQALYGTLSLPMAMIQHWVLLKRPELLADGLKIDLSMSKKLFGDAPKFDDLKRIYDAYRANRSELEGLTREEFAGKLEA